MVDRPPLPLRVAPLDGEPLDSWLEAYAHRLKTSVGDLMWALGLSDTPANPEQPNSNHVVVLRDHEAAEIERLTGVPTAQLHQMTLRRYHGHAVAINDRQRTVVRGGPLWGRARGSRYCPGCLDERQGRWLLRWRLSWTFACVHHRVLLADVCPACGQPPRTTGRLSTRDQVKPGACGNRTGQRQPCQADLRATFTGALPADHDLLAAQKFIDRQLDRVETGDTRQDPKPATTFADLRAIALWILRTAQPGDLARFGEDVDAAWHAGRHSGPRREPPPKRAAPPNAGVTGAAIAHAMNVVAQGDNTAIPVLRRLLGRRTRYAGVATVRSLGRQWDTISPNLRRLVWRARDWDLTPLDRLRYRTCTHAPRGPHDETAIRARHIPQLLWPGWSVRLIPPQGLDFTNFRRIAAAALLLPGSSHRTWSPALTALGTPNSVKGSSVLTKLVEGGHGKILTAICGLADYLDRHHAPIDYQRRRRDIGNGLLPQQHWQHLCDATDIQPTPRRLHDARRWLYERLTGSDLRYVPTPYTLSKPADRAAYMLVPLRLSAPLLRALDSYAGEHLASLGIEEPVSWEPPLDAVDEQDLPAGLIEIEPELLHRLLRDEQLTPGQAAQQLNTTIDHVRLILHEAPPLPADPAPHYTAGAVQRQRSRETLTPEYLRAAHAEGTGLRAISRDTGFDRKLVARLATDAGLTFTPGRRPTPIDADWLHAQYVIRRRTLPDIATELGVSTANLDRRAQQLGIPLRPQGGASHAQIVAKPDPRLPAILQQALTGPWAWQRLRRFQAAMQFDTLTDAARTLGVVQQTLTSQFERLEQDIGRQLFVRADRGRPMQVTARGKHLLAALAGLDPK